MNLDNLITPEGVMYIDNSMLEESYTKCPRMFEYAHVQKRVPAEPNLALRLGGALHAGLAYRHREPVWIGSSEQTAEMTRIAVKYMEDNPCENEGYRNVATLKLALSHYNNEYKVGDEVVTHNGAPLVEAAFPVPLGHFTLQSSGRKVLVVYTGRIDAVVREHEEIFVFDTKTTFMLGTNFWTDWVLKPAPRGYCWALERATGLRPAGYIIDAVNIRPPTAKGTQTIACERQHFRLSPHAINEWYQNLVSKIKRLFQDLDNGFLPMWDACVGKYKVCPYHDVCTLPPESRTTMLASGIFKHNDWTPLNKKNENEQQSE